MSFIVSRQSFGEFNRLLQGFVIVPSGNHVIGFPRTVAWSKTYPVHDIFDECTFGSHYTNVSNSITHEVFNQSP